MGIIRFFKKAFNDMKKSAKEQHEVDKANFNAAKAEARANFEANRGSNTFAKAKLDAKKNWEDAHVSIIERQRKMSEERQKQIEEANNRKTRAEERIKALKK